MDRAAIDAPGFCEGVPPLQREYAARLSDAATAGWRGLDPRLLPDVVRLAHAANLRVVVHVESAADFHTAVEAGVDQIAHIPGFRGDERMQLPDPSRFAISRADARAAARRQTAVITTLAGLAEVKDVMFRESLSRLLKANLTVLRDSDVTLLVGSDAYSDISANEAKYLESSGVFDRATLLRMWSEITPRAIFPNRRIGRLQSGYEASFLVLDGDPLADFGRVSQIRLAVKQGQRLATN